MYTHIHTQTHKCVSLTLKHRNTKPTPREGLPYHSGPLMRVTMASRTILPAASWSMVVWVPSRTAQLPGTPHPALCRKGK